jgi:CIC family chloride channel protein
MSIKVLADKNPGEILENTLFSFKDNTWVLLAFVGLTMMLKVLQQQLH